MKRHDGSLPFRSDCLEAMAVAIMRTSVEIQLIDMMTVQEVARLLAPDARVIERLRFSPDGSHLAASTQGRVIQLWDLRAIRDKLREMGVDWDLPAYLP